MVSYIHKWHIPIKVVVFSQPEDWYYAPWYNPKHLPVVELDNALAMPYERVMPFIKVMVLRRMICPISC